MKITVLAMAAITLATLAHGETISLRSGAFDGPFVSAQFGKQSAASVETNVQTTVQPGPSYDQPDALGKHGIWQIHGGYGRDLGQGFNLSVAGFAEFGGDWLDATTATFFKDSVRQKISSRVGIYFAPGFYINPQTLAYAKIGASQANHKYNRETYGVALEQRISGRIAGVGFKRKLGEHTFWTLDYTRVDYGLDQIGHPYN